MTDVEQLLEREGRRWQAGFQPPELDPMLGRATRQRSVQARWAWPIAAAVLLLAIPLVTVLVRSDPESARPPAAAKSTSAAPGSPLLGSVPWLQVVGQRDGRSVSVYVDVNLTPGWCLDAGLPTLRAGAVETASRITIRVQAYQPAGYQQPTPAPGTVLGCSAIGHGAVPLLVPLRAPVGRRTLVDASTGKTHPIEQAAGLPSLSTLPAGYVDAGVSAPQYGQAAEHTYRNGDAELVLRRQPANAAPFYPLTKIDTAGLVLGHPAKVGSQPMTGYRCVFWSDPDYGWEFCSMPAPPYPNTRALSATELLSLANGIR